MGRERITNGRYGSQFQTVGSTTLNPRKAKVLRTRGTDNRLVYTEHRERVRA